MIQNDTITELGKYIISYTLTRNHWLHGLTVIMCNTLLRRMTTVYSLTLTTHNLPKV